MAADTPRRRLQGGGKRQGAVTSAGLALCGLPTMLAIVCRRRKGGHKSPSEHAPGRIKKYPANFP